MPLRSDIAAGFRELRRFFQRLALNRELRRHAEEREVALQALGEKAWEEKIDLAGYGDLRDRLQGATARSGELAATTQGLEARKAALEGERRDVLDKFKARRLAVEEKKRPVDASLKAARDKHGGNEQSLAQVRSRLAALAAELATLEREMESLRTSTASDSSAKLAAAEERRARLRAEQGSATTAQTAAQAELPALAAEEARLKSEVDRHLAELAAIHTEERAILARIDADVARVRTEMNAATRQQQAIGTERAGLFRELGKAVYGAGSRTAALEESTQRVRAIDDARAATDARLRDSLAETQAMPAGTMSKFWGVVASGALLVVAAATGGYMLAHREAPRTAAVTVAPDPETAKDIDVERFVKSGRSFNARERAAAVQILKDDIRTMGATADPAHLPMLRKLLRSEVPELRMAAADAIGMIRPTAAETAALVKLFEDPLAPVAEAARRALSSSADPAARAIAAKPVASK